MVAISTARIVDQGEKALFKLIDETGHELDAKVEISPGEIIVHSRGGAFGKANLRNPEYRKAVRLIFERLKAAELKLDGVWLHSNVALTWPSADRLLLTSDEFSLPTDELVTLVGQRGAAKGRPEGASGHGNSTKKIRLSVPSVSAGRLAQVLGARPTAQPKRLSADVLRKVQPEHIDRAIEQLRGAAPHNFADSVDYDLLLPDGTRLPPKGVFGLALAQVIGRPALPEDFSGGRGTPCFSILEEAGYPVVRKEEYPEGDRPESEDEERIWAEGNPFQVQHLKRERAPGLSQAKRRSFIAKHGHLFCERCGLIPSQHLGPHGDACIEVHHNKVSVATMTEGHHTRLTDLMCLCANCHRIVHREQLVAKAG